MAFKSAWKNKELAKEYPTFGPPSGVKNLQYMSSNYINSKTPTMDFWGLGLKAMYIASGKVICNCVILHNNVPRLRRAQRTLVKPDQYCIESRNVRYIKLLYKWQC